MKNIIIGVIIMGLGLSGCGRTGEPPKPLNLEVLPVEVFFRTMNDAILSEDINIIQKGRCLDDAREFEKDEIEVYFHVYGVSEEARKERKYSVEFIAHRDGYVELVSLLASPEEMITQKVNIEMSSSALSKEYCIRLPEKTVLEEQLKEEGKDAIIQVAPDGREFQVENPTMKRGITDVLSEKKASLGLSEDDIKSMDKETALQVEKALFEKIEEMGYSQVDIFRMTEEERMNLEKIFLETIQSELKK